MAFVPDDEILTWQKHDFCKYGFDNSISCVPVDGVRPFFTVLRMDLIHNRMRIICSTIFNKHCTTMAHCR
jgi:hypothetical protein